MAEVKRRKQFRRLNVTVDAATMTALGLDAATVTAAELRQRLRELVAQIQAASLGITLTEWRTVKTKKAAVPEAEAPNTAASG